MWIDLWLALRSLRHARTLVVTALILLALGTGANIGIFSLLYQVIIRSLPIADPIALVSLNSSEKNYGWSMSDNQQVAVFSYPMYTALQKDNPVFTGLIGRMSFPITLAWSSETARARVEVVTGNYFAVLGLKPAMGQVFETADNVHHDSIVVLSYSYWMSRLGRDPNVLGRRVLMNDHPVIVIGIAPEDFHGLVAGQTPDLYAPVSLMPIISPGWRRSEQVDAHWLNLFGRLKTGVSVQQAQAALRPLFHSILQDHLSRMRDVNQEIRDAVLAKPLWLEPASQGLNVLRSQWQSPLLVLFAMAGVVLLIACANIASLLTIRAMTKQKEIALQLALGASKWQATRCLVIESFLLGLLGGLLGFLISGAVAKALVIAIREDDVGSWLDSRVDVRLFVLGMLLGLLCSVVVGLTSALRAVRPGLAGGLKEQSPSSIIALQGSRTRQAFVAFQICLSFLLLVGAGLFMRTFANLALTDPGFVAQDLVIISLDATLTGYSRPGALAAFEQIEERLRTLPSVKSVAHAVLSPFGGSSWENGVMAPGTRSANNQYVSCYQNAVSTDYFQALGIPLLAGRAFASWDTDKSSKVAVINKTFAHFLFDESDPLGRHIHLGSSNSDLEIVGVVRDSLRGSLRERPSRYLYTPYSQIEEEFAGRIVFFVRSKGDKTQIMSAVRAITTQLAPGIPIDGMASMDLVISRSIYIERLMTLLTVAFGILATILATVGLYGLISYSTATRTREFGIRLALGAPPKQMLVGVMREGACICGIGTASGLLLSLALAQLLQSQLYGVSARDPWTFICATVLVVVIAFFAILSPALRTTRIDPMRVLRYE
jgi:predicted permease